MCAILLLMISPGETTYFVLNAESHQLIHGLLTAEKLITIMLAQLQNRSSEQVAKLFEQTMPRYLGPVGRAPVVLEIKLPLTSYDPETIRRSIVAVHVPGWGKVDLSNLTADAREQEHLASLRASELELREPPNTFLQRIPIQLRYLLFLDYELFHSCKETWVDYQQREYLSVNNLFETAAAILTQANQQKEEVLNLEYIQKLHALLSWQIVSRPGQFRPDDYSVLPINATSASLPGIKELLLRIKKDNQPGGFLIGEFKKFKIASSVLRAVRIALEKKSDKEVLANKFEIVDAVLQELSKEDARITRNAVMKVVTQVMQDLQLDQVLSSDDPVINILRIENRIENSQLQSEFQFCIDFARSYPLAGIGSQVNDISNYSDEQIDNLAKEIYEKMRSQIKIHIFPPSLPLTIKMANDAFEKYHLDIKTAKTSEEKIAVIVSLAHEIEIIHLFLDVNCRTAYLLMELLLVLNGLKWTMLYNPNRLDGYSRDELVKEVIDGIARTEYVMNESSLLLYHDQLLELLIARNTGFNDKNLKTLERLYNQMVTPLNQSLAGQEFNVARAMIARATPPQRSDVQVNQEPNADASLRSELIADLKKYIAAIEGNTDTPNFSAGLWLYQKSRAINKEANYYLAKRLLARLENPSLSIQKAFENIDAQRKFIIEQKLLDTRPDFVDRGLNDKELSAIIRKAAQEHTPKDQKTFKTDPRQT